MVNPNIEKALEDAEWHLDMARKAVEEGAPNRIAVGYCVDSLIRATDALCWHYTNNRCKSGSGHDLHIVFKNLYNKHDLPEQYANYRNTLKNWVTTEKTKAQYLGKDYSKTDLEKAFKQTERYLTNCVKQALNDDNVL